MEKNISKRDDKYNWYVVLPYLRLKIWKYILYHCMRQTQNLNYITSVYSAARTNLHALFFPGKDWKDKKCQTAS